MPTPWGSNSTRFFEPTDGQATDGRRVAGGGGGGGGGLIAPHIDPRVGGPCAARAFAALRHQDPPPDLFVIFGTAHQPGEGLFILTEKPFETPLGVAEVDLAVAKTLKESFPFDLKRDEFLHKHEHSIEFQVIFLQHIYAQHLDAQHLAAGHSFQILPVLVGSFYEFLKSNALPSAWEPFDLFIAALRKALGESGKRVCFVAGADFSHMGRKFGDEEEMSEDFIEATRVKDREMLRHLEQGNHEEFFRYLQHDGDKQKVCGLPPIYTMLRAMPKGSTGKLLDYGLNVEEPTQSFVSFASMAYYSDGD